MHCLPFGLFTCCHRVLVGFLPNSFRPISHKTEEIYLFKFSARVLEESDFFENATDMLNKARVLQYDPDSKGQIL